MVTVSFDVAKRMAGISAKLQKQVTFAAMRALNKAGFDSKVKTEAEIQRVFDRPTPWIQRSVRYTKATRDKLVVQVDFDRWGNKSGVTSADVLRAEIDGGQRKTKRFERALQAAAILPKGYVTVPGRGVDLDAYGNVPAKAIVEIMSYMQAFGESGYKANSTYRTRTKKWKGNTAKGIRGYEYFVVRPGASSGLPPGIWRRKNYTAGERAKVGHLAHDAAQPVFLFVRSANYRKRLDFYQFATKQAQLSFDKSFPEYLIAALRTARAQP